MQLWFWCILFLDNPKMIETDWNSELWSASNKKNLRRSTFIRRRLAGPTNSLYWPGPVSNAECWRSHPQYTDIRISLFLVLIYIYGIILFTYTCVYLILFRYRSQGVDLSRDVKTYGDIYAERARTNMAYVFKQHMHMYMYICRLEAYAKLLKIQMRM